ncbi:hypothetical protein R1sor_005085 [Riccia sorocarpa]|uniref:Myb-like domain-containing protein n=1 Tax=Riccia sorocarpa TaxID=122646 RepID=A0ABD3HMC1_9MARC
MQSNAQLSFCKKSLFQVSAKGLSVTMIPNWRRNLSFNRSGVDASDEAAFDALFQPPLGRVGMGSNLELSLAQTRRSFADGEERTYVPERSNWNPGNSNADSDIFSQPLSQSGYPSMSQPQSSHVPFSEPNVNIGIDSLPEVDLFSSAPIPARTTSKRKAPAKRIPSGKKVCKKPDRVESLESDEEEDGIESSKDRWSDEHVHELIAIRAEMDTDFEQQAGKQGVNNWQRLHRRLSVAVRGFTKSWQSCKKKWQAEYKKYRTDKRFLNVSGNSRHITCKYFDVIDEAFKNRANVKKVIHGDAHLSDNPAPVESPIDVMPGTATHGLETGSVTPPSSGVVTVSPTLITRQDRKDAKRSTADRLCGLIGDIAKHSATIAQTSENFLKSFDTHMSNLIAKL